MLLCLDVGNSQIFGGLFKGHELLLRFRHDSRGVSTSDQLGVFFKGVLRENELDYKAVNSIAICSVVPAIDYPLRSMCIKYFGIEPFFLKPGVKTGLQIKYRNPIEVGADRIANAIQAITQYPEQNVIIVDFGTATTICAVNSKKEYLGGAILPGLRLSMETLEKNTAKLKPVELIKPKHAIGRSTVESLQSGLYYSQLATVKELIYRITQENFQEQKPIVIATGGIARLYETEGFFDHIHSELVLTGLKVAFELNRD